MNRYLTVLSEKRQGWELPTGIVSAFLGVIGIQVWTEDSPQGEDFFIWLIAHVVTTALMLFPLFAVGRRWLRRSKAQAIARKLAAVQEASIPIKELDCLLGVKDAAELIRHLIKLGYLQGLTSDGVELYLDGDGLEARAPIPEEKRAEPEAEGDVIAEIRRLNDAIRDDAVSEKIERIERATAGILQTLQARPERADEARRFMNYYLPMTLKLLESYRLMEGQSYQGENIRQSRRKIEAVLDEIVTAAEAQQDRLFRSEALNVEAEISALQTLMAADGLVKADGPLARAGR